MIGRSAELALVDSLLSEGERLITLSGPAGVGKTRLARAVVERLPPGETSAVEGSQVTTDEQLLASVLHALHVVEVGGDPFDSVALATAAGHLLLLDNLEHLPGARHLVSALLARCPALRILTTTRHRLQLLQERLVLVQPLSVEASGPDSSQELSAAARLFLQHSRERTGRDVRREQWQDVARLCRLLDGLPLAIELAAARTELLTPRQIIGELEVSLDVLAHAHGDDGGHGSVVASLEWSWALLTPSERTCLAVLSTFHGRFSVEDAHALMSAVTGRDEGRAASIDLLERLARHSLVERRPHDVQPSLRLLWIVRRFARAQLSRTGVEDTAVDAHERHCEALVLAHADAYTSEAAPRAMALVEAHYDDIRHVLDALAARPEPPERLAAIVTALWRFWFLTGRLSEGVRYVDLALRRLQPGQPGHTDVRLALVWLSTRQGRHDTAGATLEQLIALDRRAPFPPAERLQLLMAMLMPLWTGTRAPDDELRLATEALALAEAQTHAWCQALALNHVAHAHWHLGDVERYEIAQRDSVRLWRMIGDRIGLAYSLRQQGEVDALRGRRAEAHGSFVEAALLLEEMGDRLGLAEVVAALSTLQLAEGRSDHAAWLSDAGQALARSVGAPLVAMTTPFATGTGGTPAAAGTWAHALGSMADVAVIVEYVKALARPGAPALPAGSTGPAPALTPRESEVLVLLGEGLTNQQIARLLRISIKTVERHTDSLYRKLGAANRAGAVALAYQQGLLSAQERPA